MCGLRFSMAALPDQVAVDGAKKGGKKASRPPSPDADGDDGDGGAGGGSAEPETSGRSGDDDDRWGFECFRCGQDGDLLCCEVGNVTSADREPAHGPL